MGGVSLSTTQLWHELMDFANNGRGGEGKGGLPVDGGVCREEMRGVGCWRESGAFVFWEWEDREAHKSMSVDERGAHLMAAAAQRSSCVPGARTLVSNHNNNSRDNNSNLCTKPR